MVTAGRSPDAPTDRAGDGHRQAAAECGCPVPWAHYPSCVTAGAPSSAPDRHQQKAAEILRQAVTQRNSQALADGIAVALQAAEQEGYKRGCDEAARKCRRPERPCALAARSEATT